MTKMVIAQRDHQVQNKAGSARKNRRFLSSLISKRELFPHFSLVAQNFYYSADFHKYT